MLDYLPDEIVIEICIKKPRLDLYMFSFVNKKYKKLYWESTKHNILPFKLYLIDSLLELYLYLLRPKIDIIYTSDDNYILFYLEKYRDKINVCHECDIRLCDKSSKRPNSSYIYF